MAEPTPNPSPEKDPHGIDHDRARRLVVIFAAVIGIAFIVVVALLVGALALDIIQEPEPIEPVPIIPDPEPIPERADLAGSHP